MEEEFVSCNYSSTNMYISYYVAGGLLMLDVVASSWLMFKYEFQKSFLFSFIMVTMAVFVVFGICAILYSYVRLSENNQVYQLEPTVYPEIYKRVNTDSLKEYRSCSVELGMAVGRVGFIGGITVSRILSFERFMGKHRLVFMILIVIPLGSLVSFVIFASVYTGKKGFYDTYFVDPTNMTCETNYCIPYSMELTTCIPSIIVWLALEVFVLRKLKYKSIGSIINITASIMYIVIYTISASINIVREFFRETYISKIASVYIMVELIYVIPNWVTIGFMPLTLLLTVNYKAPKKLEIIVGHKSGREALAEYSKTIKCDDVIRAYLRMLDYKEEYSRGMFPNIQQRNRAIADVFAAVLDPNNPKAVYIDNSNLTKIKLLLSEASNTVEIPANIYDRLIDGFKTMIEVDVLPGFYRTKQYSLFEQEMKLISLNDGVDIITAIRNKVREKKKRKLKSSFENAKTGMVIIEGIL